MSILVLATSPFVEDQRAALALLAPEERIHTDPVAAPPGDIEALLAFKLAPGIAPRFPRLRFVACVGRPVALWGACIVTGAGVFVLCLGHSWPVTLGGCLVLGRYVIQRGMGPEWSAGLAAGRRHYRWSQTALWKLKSIPKALGGVVYLKWRQAMIEK